MSTKQVKPEVAPEVQAVEAPTTVEPTLADLVALVKAQAAQLAELTAATKTAPAVEHDFSEQAAEASASGFKAQVVPALQKGASPALRVDY